MHIEEPPGSVIPAKAGSGNWAQTNLDSRVRGNDE